MMKWIKITTERCINLDSFYDAEIKSWDDHSGGDRRCHIELKHKYKKNVAVRIDVESYNHAQDWIKINLLEEKE